MKVERLFTSHWDYIEELRQRARPVSRSKRPRRR